MNNLSRSDCPFLQQPTKVFFRDVYDHVVQIVDTIETLREMVSACLDIYLSSVSYRLNAVMRVLTVITTDFHAVEFHCEHLRNEFRTYAGIKIRVGLSSGVGGHVGGRDHHAGAVQKQTLAVTGSWGLPARNLLQRGQKVLTAHSSASLLLRFDAIHKVGRLAEAGRRQVTEFFIVEDDAFAHHL